MFFDWLNILKPKHKPLKTLARSPKTYNQNKPKEKKQDQTIIREYTYKRKPIDVTNYRWAQESVNQTDQKIKPKSNQSKINYVETDLELIETIGSEPETGSKLVNRTKTG